MKCEWVQQNVVFYVYDELADDARHELEQHIARCKGCAAELESAKLFRGEFAQLPIEEPSPSFVAASRMKLQEALETAEQGGWFHRLVFDPVRWLHQVRFAPALAAAIFIFGFAGGIGASYKIVNRSNTPGGSGPTPAPTTPSRRSSARVL
jgi:anti-sigma factor RsiW